MDLLRATFPGGSITGAPKIGPCRSSTSWSAGARGLHRGSFGWIAERQLDLNIIIRTLVRKGDRLFLQAGGGIVADSVPVHSTHETLHKAAEMLRAVSASIAERAG